MNKITAAGKAIMRRIHQEKKLKVLYFALGSTKIINKVMLIPARKQLPPSPKKSVTDNYLVQSLTL
jgi:hypothetical protein